MVILIAALNSTVAVQGQRVDVTVTCGALLKCHCSVKMVNYYSYQNLTIITTPDEGFCAEE